MIKLKVISLLLALLMLISVCPLSYADTEETTAVDNSVFLDEQLKEWMKKNNVTEENISFAYYDFGRELQYVYNGDRLFEPNDSVKLPIAFVYYKELSAGRFHLYDEIGDENLRTVFLRSLTKDYNRDDNATTKLVETYGGKEAMKRAMYELTYTKVPDAFFETYSVTAQYMIDFLTKYYNEAKYSSTDFKNMLITPLKQFSPNRFSETYIYDCKVTHRYGFSRTKRAMVDVGIVNTANPFGLVIQVEGVKDPEEYLAQIAELAYKFNLDYGDLLLSQLTTLPDIPENEKNNYDSRKTYNAPLMITVIVSTVFAAAIITIVYIIDENRKKNRDRLD